MASNDRGYEWDDVDVIIENYQLISGRFVGDDQVQGATSVEPRDFHRVDWLTATVVYPDGHMETRTIVGPFDDYEDFDAVVEAWFVEGTP